MCDCYFHKCSICGEGIPVHIKDFDYPRTDVEVFCEQHIPEENVTIFENLGDDDLAEYPFEKKGWRCAIRLQDGIIEPSAVGVYPNVGCKHRVTIFQKRQLEGEG